MRAVFVNTYGSGVSAAFRSEIIAAENFYQSHYLNNCTISCSFDLQSLNPAYGGENSFNPVVVSYAQLRGALQSHATTADQLAAAAALNNLADPSGGSGFYVSAGEARILGLAGPGSGVDDSVVLNSYYWTASELQSYPDDAISTLEHEISEGAMGRIGGLGVDGYSFAPMDLFRYTAAGQRDFTGGQDGQPTYFSVNGTNVNTGLRFHSSVNSFGQFDGFDFADWDGAGSDSNYNDPFGPGGPGAGGTGVLSPTDLSIMDVLGWTRAPAKADDFYGSGTSDILFRNASTGDTWFEAMSGGAFAGWQQIGGSDTRYCVAGAGDFYGASASDILFRNASTGDTWFEAMSNGALAGWHQIGGSDTHYCVAGVGDFFGNGVDDILFRNSSTGDLWVEAISDGAFAGWDHVGASSSAYAVAGIGDFDGDVGSDILLRNAATGDMQLGALSNGVFAGWHEIGGNTNYSVVGVGDYFGNGTDDVLFRNSATGDTWFAVISNGGLSGWHDLGVSNTNYSVVGIGDYFGNGTDDVLFRNSSTGDSWFAVISNGGLSGWQQVGGSNPSYAVT
jgi:hypothetical protein